MRCTHCDYRLWNLSSRQCPECGTPFRPSQWEFVPRSVRFLCPHCMQHYYGTDANGHLEPRSFDCVRCDRRIDMDDMILVVREGVDEEQTQVEQVPWLKPGDRGLLKAWLATVWMSLIHPGRFMRRVPLEDSLDSALRYAAFSYFMIVALMVVTNLVLGLGVTFVLGAAVVFPMPLMIWGLTAHAMLRLTGRTAGGLDRSFQALCFATGAALPVAVPLLGPVFGWLCPLVSAAVLLSYGQEVGGVRAAIAMLPVPFTIVLIVVGLSL